MTKLVNTIINLIRENDLENDFFQSAYGSEYGSEYGDEDIADFKEALAELGVKKVKFEDSYGGEGCGDDFWTVYSFSDGKETVLIKFDGYYGSYSGSDFHEMFEAKAVPKEGFNYVKA
jgi:hypothetical protein